ncbi:formin-like protein 11 [Neltuma alba]|uniref:formin-like protein 11 n=1 Tax=Neltuma alba TaxID=207710 RepID=UPI0010A2B32B|nr:formin-like protein 11 [Prosopis alba]XP_028784412.1 formin-like protein 11 [Prosopis alba]
MIFACTKMASASEALSSILFIILFLLISLSFQKTYILSVDALFHPAGNFHIHVLSENGQENDIQIKKISGQDENNGKGLLIAERFRALLGLHSFQTRRSSNGDSEFLSPSPSPSPTTELEAPSPSPSPVPLPHVYAHHFPPRHRSHFNPSAHKFQHKDRGKAQAVLVGVLVSVGFATVICAVGLIWFFRKCRKHAKKPKRTMPLCSKNGGSGGIYENSSSQVGLNSTIDLFYLNALGEDIEQHTCSLKQTSETVNTSSNDISIPKCAIYEKMELNQEVISSGYDNASSSSTKEILSVHEDAESVKHESESDDGEDKIITMERNSSETESFHSFADSHSSNVRLSDASAGSVTETVSPSPRVSQSNSISSPIPFTKKIPHSPQTSTSIIESPQSRCITKQEEQKIETRSQRPQAATPPPPPPPPPPTLQMPLFSLHSLTSSSRISSDSPLSLSSPRNSDSNSALNISGGNESPSPLQPLPPRSPRTIPPPPCPPSPFKGNNNAKTPPPPPSQLPQFTPLGKDGAPLPKLKPLHWDKVRAAPDRTMVWDKLRTSSFEFDEEMIESLFGYNLQNSLKNDETKSKSPSPSKHLLEPKRLQNITILSKALNVTAEQVCETLIQGKGLALQQLEALVKMVPTKEEEDKLANYKGDVNDLGSAEKFVRAMLSIPFAFQRVEAMLYRETFEDEIVHLRNSFSMLEEACKELRSSRLFLKLLEAVLKTGNRMNVGTIRGGARAFKLDALLKLADVKGTDGKTTLLHFVVQEIVRSEGIRVSDSIMGKISQKSKNRTEEEKEDDYRRMGLELVSGLSTELYNVKKTATIDLDVLASSVSNLKDGMAKLQYLVQELHADEKGENFVNSMKAFLNYAERNLRDLQGDEDRVLARVKEITEYFHGNVSKEDANPLRIFVIVRDFMGMLDNVCKEIRRSQAPRCPNPLAPFR